MFNRNRAVGT